VTYPSSVDWRCAGAHLGALANEHSTLLFELPEKRLRRLGETIARPQTAIHSIPHVGLHLCRALSFRSARSSAQAVTRSLRNFVGWWRVGNVAASMANPLFA
jgi:hypothetical protein